MNKIAVTTGAAVIGATGLNDAATDVMTDIFTWAHIANFHASSWAAIIIIGLGAWLHRSQQSTPQA